MAASWPASRRSWCAALLTPLCPLCLLCRSLGERYGWDLNRWRSAMEARGDKAFTEASNWGRKILERKELLSTLELAVQGPPP